MDTNTLRRISGALILAIALGMSSGTAIVASGYTKYSRARLPKGKMKGAGENLSPESRLVQQSSRDHTRSGHDRSSYKRHEAQRGGVG